MGRKKTIDRAEVLAAAERIVSDAGAAALTIDAVAKASGITKGGVQSCFGTKDELIGAMLDRAMTGYRDALTEIGANTEGAIARIRAHIRVTETADAESQKRAAALLAVLMQSPVFVDRARAWYREIFNGLDLRALEGRRARLAFLAVEGLFFLKFFELLPLEEGELAAIFGDIEGLFEANPTED